MGLKKAAIALVTGSLLAFPSLCVRAETAIDELPPAKERSTEARIEALEKSLEAHREALTKMMAVDGDKTSVGSNCHFETYCCAVSCCRWGSTGNGGTAKCLEPCCAAECERFVCD